MIFQSNRAESTANAFKFFFFSLGMANQQIGKRSVCETNENFRTPIRHPATVILPFLEHRYWDFGVRFIS